MLVMLIHFCLVTFIILSLSPTTCTTSSPKISAIFAFGDSSIDTGMNNEFTSPIFKCNHPPYGRDLPEKNPTGRFSNGKLVIDFLASTLDLKDLLPAYLDPKLTLNDLLIGVSFASGGCGLDDLTLQVTQVYSLVDQLGFFDETVRRIEASHGEKNSSDIVENALFVVSVGMNDLLWNVYDVPLTQRKFQFTTTDQYTDFLIQNLSSLIQDLYRRGARRIMVAGFAPMGCFPLQQTFNGIINLRRRRCHRQQNIDCNTYNTKLQALLSSLQNTTLPDSRLLYYDIYNPMMDMFHDPDKYGFVEVDRGCCGTGLVESGFLCTRLSPTCSNASSYMFWDSVHLTEHGFSIVVNYNQKALFQFLFGSIN